MLKALRNVDILNDPRIPEEVLDNLSYELGYCTYNPGSKLFTIGGHCSSIKIIVNGLVDIYINNNDVSDIFIDTLYSGWNIGGYNCVTKDDYTITGVAKTDTTVLALTFDVLEKYIQKYDVFRSIIKEYETYIDENGLPYLDYKLYRSQLHNISPLRKFQQGVRRIMRILLSYQKETPFLDTRKEMIIQQKMSRFQRRRNTIHANVIRNMSERKMTTDGNCFLNTLNYVLWV